jgi:hypothetical protein
MIYSPFWGSRYLTIIFKYLVQSIQTFWVLFQRRPRTVLVMTPPVVACIPVWLYTRIMGAQYAIDAHSGAFLDRRWMPIMFLHKFFSRRALVTMVTEQFLVDIVEGWGANAMIVGDVPPCFAKPRPLQLAPGRNMTFVSTFTEDEPLDTFLGAARQNPDVHFYVTGRLRNAKPEVLKQAPDNVTFTDFLSDSEYAGLLTQSDAVICLTKEDHTMQRGAYEAVYMNKPVITSDFEILRQAFPIGAVHVKNTAAEISRGIAMMKENCEMYAQQVRQLRSKKIDRWRGVERDLGRLFRIETLAPALDQCETADL